MSRPSKPPSPEGFTSLGGRISLHRASAPTSTTQPSRPTLIVICTWMGAAEKHISIYAKQYLELFPTADILLIRASVKDVFSSPAAHLKRLAPALELIESFTNSPPLSPSSPQSSSSSSSSASHQPQLLLHAFSNGGSIVSSHLALNLRARGKAKLGTSGRGNGTVFAKLILDCTPSKPDMEESTRAMTVAVPKTYFRKFLAECLARLAFIMLRLYQIVMRKDNDLVVMRRRLNESGLFTGPRLYLYSESDAMVGWRYVREHADEARRKGYEVRKVVFEKAAHCALAVEDFEKYWGAVREFLGAGM